MGGERSQWEIRGDAYFEEVLMETGMSDQHVLLDQMEDVGWKSETGAGPGPLAWDELKAWAEVWEEETGRRPDAWTLRQMRDLSRWWCKGNAEGSRREGAVQPMMWTEFDELFACIEQVRD